MAKIPESLADRLHSLGVQSGAKDITPSRKTQQGIEDVVEGHYIETSFGEVFQSDVVNGMNYAHGCVTFEPVPISTRLTKWAGSASSTNDIDLSSMVFLDTETTGLAGGTGTLPFMIGVGRFTPDGFVTSQIFTRNPAEERAQLELLDRMLSGVNSIVTYNGKSFDIPILKTRYILNGLPSPLNELVHFDLLPLSRRLWRRRLENRSLKDIESEILAYTRSQMEVPGWEIPVLYFNYLRTGDPLPLAGVFYHNAIDIQSLAALFLYMNQMAQDLENPRNILPIDTFSMAIQLESTGEMEKAVGLYEQLLSVELPEGYAAELQLRYARILKRNGDFTHAAHVLHNNQELTDIRVIIQLAKVMEHQHRDIQSALEWTEKAINQLEISANSLGENTFTQQKNELVKRKNRLLQKLESSSAQ
jgi:uncharacterized protein